MHHRRRRRRRHRCRRHRRRRRRCHRHHRRRRRRRHEPVGRAIATDDKKVIPAAATGAVARLQYTMSCSRLYSMSCYSATH
jgi:hypothetical protein